MLFKRRYKSSPPERSISRQELRERQKAVVSNAVYSNTPKTTSVIHEAPDMRKYAPNSTAMPSMSITYTAVNPNDYNRKYEEENRRMLTHQMQRTDQNMQMQQFVQMQNLR
jgi:hypothetical protein